MKAVEGFFQTILAAPGAELPWAEIAAHPWWEAMANCPQDPIYHAEGDVAIHTRMVIEELRALRTWQELPTQEQGILLLAALLHDVGKPQTTRHESNGRITSEGHSRVGAIESRRMLWEAGVPFAEREQICALIRWHQRPFYLIDQENAHYMAFTMSQTVRCDLLTILAEADIRGRITPDYERPLVNIACFREFCAEEGCLTGPRLFPSDHSRVLYFRSYGERDPNYCAYETGDKPTFLLLSGLPGSGKDTWIQKHGPKWPVVSLDEIRTQRNILPTDSQEPVLAAAREQARVYLRKGESLIWNATNLSRELRTKRLRFAEEYDTRIHIVYVEAPYAVQRQQNTQRSARVPDGPMERMFRQWEIPDLTEAHRLEFAT